MEKILNVQKIVNSDGNVTNFKISLTGIDGDNEVTKSYTTDVLRDTNQKPSTEWIDDNLNLIGELYRNEQQLDLKVDSEMAELIGTLE